CVAKVFLAFGRETLIQDRTRTSNNDSKEPTLRFDCYKFLFHRACLATFATQSALSGHASCVAQCPLSGVKRTSNAQIEFFRFRVVPQFEFFGRSRMDRTGLHSAG